MIDYKQFSDDQLTTSLKEGDHTAFLEIFNRYNAILINFAYRRVTDLPLAEDIVHDAFVYLWEKRNNLFFSGGVQSFIFTVVRNRILDHFKKQKVSQKYIDHFYKFMSKEENTTDFLVRHKDLSELIDREIEALPDKMRIVFTLVRKYELSRKEIAELLKMPENTVKTNMQRAIRILKGRLGDASVIAIFYLTFRN
ncbi:RNA polymerase sigma-70 factor (family 1) [Pedobacter sp. AK017]|uniref:RNA polymerase sigma factor n=1 Tax=Pedobacter sp. AK017 TaxID=2723073 RepID=UPI00161A7F23|nr:RNA polymerase sigma-70 factor [Pedobacter sp. AK017]MBB5436604.1 RNA polymerase sigma-70 factor (family 1) [Pedobacter sp. AK017]